MQDPSLYSQIKAQVTQQQQPQPQFPENEHLKCPRCDSTNTKFCYYNNYNLSQPRHYCKNCKRYWTKGGTLRNIPVGGGSRKNTKRSSTSSSSATAASKRPAPAASVPEADDKNKIGETLPLIGENFGGQFGNLMGASGSFSSLLGAGEGHLGNLLDGPEQFGDPDPGQDLYPQVGSDEFLNIQSGGEGSGETGCWSGSNKSWPGLSIYTPGSTFQ